MARVVSSKTRAESPRSELKVLDALAPVEGWNVLHSVVWQGRRNGKPADGEADFVVLVPNRGVLVLEVKGGGIDIRGGEWYSTDANGIENRIKNPFEQALASKHALIQYFQAACPEATRIPIVHAVVFPDIEVFEGLAMYGPRAIVVDRSDLGRIEHAFSRAFDHWEAAGSVSPPIADRIVELLAPTVQIRRALREELTEACAALVTLTDRQVDLLQSLKRHKRVAVLGGAGTGKTLLAVEKARQLQAAGLRTLLLCFNAPLRAHLSGTLRGTGVDVETFHSLVFREMKSARRMAPSEPDARWYEVHAAEELREASRVTGTSYDAVIVDEGQDFDVAWTKAVLEALSAPEAHLYVFADSHQDLYRRDWRLPEDLLAFDLSVNCRNTRPIAEKVARFFGDAVEGRLAAGPPPEFTVVDRAGRLGLAVAQLVEGLIGDDGLEPGRIVVLTDSQEVVADLRTRSVEGHAYTTIEGVGIPVETIPRFKGLERDVVVVALSDRACDRNFAASAYVAFSRARAALYVLGSSAVLDRLGWDGPVTSA